ncbi:MAG: hypothetical protein MH252_02765 [Thermosynechococcaceae cyanobacterium MS004]|nr:hypothetical protein [Thermosynechococcaceae cyanobacterium MS004]
MSAEPALVNQIESLQAALGCLDLSLDSELALYRRQQLQESALLVLPEASPSSEELGIENLDEDLAKQDTPNHAIALSDQSALDAAADGLDQIGRPEESEESEESEDNEQAGGLKVSSSELALSTTLADEEDAETLPEPYTAETVSKPEVLDRFLDPSIEDYLESSEALLKHLDQSESDTPKSSKRSRAGRSQPSRPPVAQAKSSKSSLPKSSPPKSSLPNSQATVQSSEALSSNLAFKVLGAILAIALLIGLSMVALKTLTDKGRKVSPQSSSPSSSVSPSPVSQPSGSQPPVSQSLGSQSSGSQPAVPQPSASLPSPVTPTPSSQSSSPAVAVTPAPYYIVVAAYDGDASLQRARTLVPDAFIADVQGKRMIQLSFLESLPRAQRLVNELKNAGFPASVMAQN